MILQFFECQPFLLFFSRETFEFIICPFAHRGSCTHHEEANVEYWFARELMPLLGYERWENFDKAIIRAMESCETSGIEVTDHFQ